MVETIGFRHPFITNIVEHHLHVCSSSGDCAEVEVVFWINMSPPSDDPRFLSPVTTVTRQHGRLAERGGEQTTAAKVFFKRIFILFMLPFAILHRLNTCEKAENEKRKQTIKELF